MKHTIQALVENRFGVLARVASLFSARGYNIDSLAVAETHEAGVSCMTIVVDAPDERILEQIKKQLHKLIDVITVVDFTHKEHIERELLLIKIPGKPAVKKIASGLARKYGVKIIPASGGDLILEICADRLQEENITRELKKTGIKEMIRTGKTAISK